MMMFLVVVNNVLFSLSNMVLFLKQCASHSFKYGAVFVFV